MKPRLVLLSLLVLLCCTHPTAAQQTDTLALSEDDKEIVMWLRQNALPLRHVEAGNGFADLQPLKQILKDVKVVGLGEATHGTREFFQIKHRLLEFLVTEMGFNAFALEAPYAASKPINDYVLYGRGDLATVLTGQGYVLWDTEEFMEMLRWLRHYNDGISDDKKVKFYGLDLSYNQEGNEEILAYFHKVAPEVVIVADSLFRLLEVEVARWPLRMGEASQRIMLHSLPPLQDLIDYLTANRDTLISRSSLAQFEEVLLHTQVMKQWVMANTTALLPPLNPVDIDMRSLYMAKNLVNLVEKGGPEAKFVVWAFDTHLSKGQIYAAGGEPEYGYQMGYFLQEEYGEKYYAFGLEFNEGSWQFRTVLPDSKAGDLKTRTVPTGPVGSLPWYFARTDMDGFILNLRTTINNAVVEQWLNSPQDVYMSGWYGSEEVQDDLPLQKVNVMRVYDGIIFIDRTTSVRPTPNALRSAAKRECC
jgi:erythromycin esterase